MIAGEEYPKRPRKGSVLPQVLLTARFERRSGRKLLSDCSELSADTRNISATLFGGRVPTVRVVPVLGAMGISRQAGSRLRGEQRTAMTQFHDRGSDVS